MTKMDMIWVSIASILYPETHRDHGVSETEIHQKVSELFNTKITPVMIRVHLVGSQDRAADKLNPNRGGSRNRYLAKDSQPYYRLYKKIDLENDGWDKTGPHHPQKTNVLAEYRFLIEWYNQHYFLTL